MVNIKTMVPALALLGIYNVVEVGHDDRAVPVTPNTLYICRYCDDAGALLKAVGRYVPAGKPVIVDNTRIPYDIWDYIEDKEVVANRQRDGAAVFIPSMSAIVACGDYDSIGDAVARIFSKVIGSGDLRELMTMKQYAVLIDGVWRSWPDLKALKPATTTAGLPRSLTSLISRALTALTSTPILAAGRAPDAEITDINMGVRLTIRKVRFDMEGIHKMFTLEEPITMKGRVIIRDGSIKFEGELLDHPNVDAMYGGLCRGTLPPFDRRNPLKWLARLLNMLSVPDIDGCVDFYSGTFMKKYADRLPPELLELYEKVCRD